MGLLDGILNGLGWIWDQTGGQAVSSVWDQLVSGLVRWVTDALAWFVDALLTFFERSSTPNLGASWFAGGPIGAGAHSPYGVVASLALTLLLLCVLLSVVHALAIGEAAALVGRLARDIPLAVLGIVATIGVVQVLLGAADELSLQVLRGTEAGAHAMDILRTLSQSRIFGAQPSFVVFLLGLVAVLAAFLLWVELLVRASLLYVLLALSPLAYAAFVWPSARRVLRRLVELVLALILSKVVIAITLAVAASALASSTASGTLVPAAEAQLGTLLVGAIMFLLAVFAPFVVLRLFPTVEAAVVARGISRAPARATQTAMLTSLTVTRLAGLASSAGAGTPRPASSGAAGSLSGSSRARDPSTRDGQPVRRRMDVAAARAARPALDAPRRRSPTLADEEAEPTEPHRDPR